MINRRHFLKVSAATATGIAVSPFAFSEVSKKTSKVGIQLFSIPTMMSRDFEGTMKKLAGIGYKEIEFFGPYEFSAPETIEGWKPLADQLGITQNAFYGHKPAEIKRILSDLGLTTPSVHLDLFTFRRNLHPAMDQLEKLGTKYAAIPAIANPDDRADFGKLAEEFNSFGKEMAKHGITFVYHNHGYEHAQKDGKVLMNVLLNETDPKTVKFELDIFWMSAAGASPLEYLKKYPGRFKLLHLKDASEPVRFSGDGNTPDQWFSIFGKMADPGTGVFDIPAIIDAASKSGAEHFYLERDLAPEPEQTLTRSFSYLSKTMK